MISESEALERTALQDLHQAAPAELVKSLGLGGLRIGPVFVSIAAALPATAIVINRTLGLGLSWQADPNEIVSVLAEYRRSGVKRFFIQLHPQARPDGIRGWLESHDLHEARGWQKFSRGTEAIDNPATDLEIREIGPEHGQDFGDIVCDAFDIGEAASGWLAQLAGRDRWHIFMSFDDGVPAGAGALFVNRNLGWLDYAATSTRFRRRGSQRAIQAARIRRALELGCRRIYTCTGVATAGDPQHSYRNILKSGFKLEEIRLNFSPRQ